MSILEATVSMMAINDAPMTTAIKILATEPVLSCLPGLPVAQELPIVRSYGYDPGILDCFEAIAVAS